MPHLIVKQKSLFLTIIFSLLFFLNCFGADLLDSIKNKTKLVNDLKDVYRVFNINHEIFDQREYINLLLNESSDHEIKAKLNEYIKVCEGLKQTFFFDAALNLNVNKYLTLTIQSYKIAKSNGFKSGIFKKDYKNYQKATKSYQDYLGKTYPTSRFVNMTEKEYWQINDKKNYIKSKDYSAYEKLKKPT